MPSRPFRPRPGITTRIGFSFDDGLLFYNRQEHLNPFLTVRTADSLGLFVDDQWSPTKRLTLNLGFRFDRMSTKYGEGKVFDYLTQPSDINDPNLGVIRTRAGTDNIFDFKTFSPRLGVTYQLTNDGKTVIRANYGRYYMPLAVEFLRRFGPDMPFVDRHWQVYGVPWDAGRPGRQRLYRLDRRQRRQRAPGGRAAHRPHAQLHGQRYALREDHER